MKLPPLDYICPATLTEAIAALAVHGGNAKVIAGGQSLMPMLAFRLAAPSVLVDIGRLPDLKSISISAEGIDIGALVTWRDIERDVRLAQAHPLFAAAIAHVAHYQVRNRGTVGGSMAHADPAAEMPGIAVTCDATLTIIGSNGTRIVSADEFITGGLSTVLEADEILTSIRLPLWKKARRWAFEEFARRRGDFALAGVAAFFDIDAQGLAYNAHIGVIGVADRPMRLPGVEAILDGRRINADVILQAAAVARDAVDPADDIHAEAAYRRDLLGVLLERALARAANITLPEAA
ncbi:FAD binding domain-containing protein [Tardiphaga sp. 866_E4_N2_1]|jgi:carbon-monoxide dehydrogenase medium subunit|uniref:FAD binding domain-containing protein n=1 Tax=unclassified Tardiphaga TaxID=2631404 RepID=UPI003F21C575